MGTNQGNPTKDKLPKRLNNAALGISSIWQSDISALIIVLLTSYIELGGHSILRKVPHSCQQPGSFGVCRIRLSSHPDLPLGQGYTTQPRE
jgi:hypothetical protein